MTRDEALRAMAESLDANIREIRWSNPTREPELLLELTAALDRAAREVREGLEDGASEDFDKLIGAANDFALVNRAARERREGKRGLLGVPR